MMNRLKYIILLVAMLIITSCSKEKNNNTVFEKDISTKEDATTIWLRNNDNYNNSKSYFPVFYKYYNNKIVNKEYTEAAKILDIVSTKLAFFYDFNEPFLATVQEFDAKYRKNVPALKTIFVDNYYGEYEYDKGNFQKSCDYFKKITKIEPNDYKSCNKIARAYYKLSYIYYGMGKQNLSLQANFQALKFSTKINDIEGIGAVYANYTNIYRAIKDKKKAILYSNKAIQCFVQTGNTYDTYMSLYNKICTYDDFSDTRTSQLIDSVMVAFDKSEYDSDVLKIAFSDWKVLYLLRENKFAEAKKMLDGLKPLVKKVNSDNWTQDYDATVVEYEAMSNPKSANIKSIETSIPLLKENRQYEKLSLFYNVLKKHAVKNNDFKNALSYEEEMRAVDDSLGSVTMKDKIIEIETKYQTQKKQQQIVLQKKTIQNNNNIIALLIASLIAVVFSGLAFSLKRKQQKLKLEKENVQQYTKQLLEKTEEDRKRIASDLHDSVSHELLSLKSSFEQKNEATNSKIDSIINDIRSISRNLHPILFDKIGLKSSVEQLVERAQSDNDFMVTADIDYLQSFSTSDELQLYRIIQEALSNIIKYANAIAAKITISEKNNIVFVEIKDNGKGFDVSEKLNGKNAFGLHNIIERSRAIGGEAKINSDKNGTIITIEIKKQL
jgi:two-component system, NarL family, sensor kinase